MLTNEMLNQTNKVLIEIQNLIEKRFLNLYEIYEKNREIYYDTYIITNLREEKNSCATDFVQFCNNYFGFWNEYLFQYLIHLDYSTIKISIFEKNIEFYIEDKRDEEKTFYSIPREFFIMSDLEFENFLKTLDEKFHNIKIEIGKYKIRLENSKIENEKSKKEKRYKEYLKLKEEFEG